MNNGDKILMYVGRFGAVVMVLLCLAFVLLLAGCNTLPAEGTLERVKYDAAKAEQRARYQGCLDYWREYERTEMPVGNNEVLPYGKNKHAHCWEVSR